MKWVWPFRWYWRIKQLERENAALLKEARRWEGVARAAAVAQCGMTAAYVAAIAGLSSTISSMPTPRMDLSLVVSVKASDWIIDIL